MKDSFYKQLIEESPIGYAYNKITCDDAGIPCDFKIIDTNEAYANIIGLQRSEITGRQIIDILPQILNYEFDWIDFYGDVALNGTRKNQEHYSKYTNTWYRIYTYSPEKYYFINNFIDISKEKEQMDKLEDERKRMEYILEGTNVGTWEWNVQTGNVLHNERWAEIFGYTLAELSPITNDTWKNFVHPDDIKGTERQDRQLVSQEIKFYDDEYRMKHKNGSWVWIYDRGKVVSWTEDGKPLLISGTHADITEKKRKEEEILFLSFHDQLTGLYNRRFYEEELRRLDKDRNLPLSIIMGDVNGLKLVNDSFGHSVGDELLIKAAEILKKGCRSDDIISRVGGDEFVILLPQTNEIEAEQMINRIKNISAYEKMGSFNISISFGFETKNEMDYKIEDVYKKAEDNMYNHKLFESPSIHGKTVNTIIKTLYEKNKREEAHSQRVSKLCESMGEALGLSSYKMKELKTVGLLHDIGKIAIGEHILNKPGKLTEEEMNEIKRHPEIGYRILSTVNEMAEMADYVLAHHERWDGNGYPKGLKADKIPLESRIIAIADAYDAMTGERSYRKPMQATAVLEELRLNAGTQFDPYLVNIFIEKVL